MAVEDPDPAAADLPGQGLEHQLRRQRAGRRRPLPRVVIGLIADVGAVAVVGERHAQPDEVKKGLGRALGFGHGDVAVHGAAGGQVAGHIERGVREVAGEGQLVVGLLVGPGVGRRPRPEPVGDDGDVGLAVLVEADSRVEAGRSAADDERVQGVDAEVASADHGPARLHRDGSPFSAVAARTATAARKTSPKTMKASAARKSTAQLKIQNSPK